MTDQRYSVEVQHKQLGKYRYISGTDPHVVQQKAAAQSAQWEQQWAIREASQKRSMLKEKRKAFADQQTSEAEGTIVGLKNVLSKAVKSSGTFDWELLKDQSVFNEVEPRRPVSKKVPAQPSMMDLEFQVFPTVLDYLYRPWLRNKRRMAEERFKVAEEQWQAEVKRIRQLSINDAEAYKINFDNWQKRKAEFLKKQSDHHADVDALKEAYHARRPDAVERYCTLVLDASDYPDCCPQDNQVSFIAENHTLLVEYRLPAVADLPRIKQYKYIASREAIEQIELKQSDINHMYDNLIYQICLRVIHEIFNADTINVIENVVFNGWVEFVNPSNGKLTRSCIVSLHATREEFLAVNLGLAEPKACFKALKGVGASQLHGMVPVAPLLRINRSDARFVESHDVAAGIEAGTNVAAIGWEDFEHLIREIFEKEFSKGGGEVKVTRASRDGGVDAIAFDPDPLRGGKIVIQAKRYTNTVSVSAVRDLYGTVVNEGAAKGILVTTSTFGPDAYTFAKNKPLTLFDGGNLLYLLEQHGHRAYIDLAEAKKLNVEPLTRSVTENQKASPSAI